MQKAEEFYDACGTKGPPENAAEASLGKTYTYTMYLLNACRLNKE